jgi:excisionase family DNA binding protein
MRLAMTTKQVAALLGVTPNTVRRWVRRGWLKGYRLSGHIYVSRDAVRRNLFTLMTDPEASTAGERARMKEVFSPAVQELRSIIDEVLETEPVTAAERAEGQGWQVLASARD